MEDIKDKKVFLHSVEELTLEELAARVADTIHHDDAAYFIALLESMYQSWEVSESLINHFDSVKEIYKKELEEDERNLSPKNLLDK